MKTHYCTDGRIESFNDMIMGECCCGEVIVKITGSNQTNYVNGDRFVYVDDQSNPACIFRCRNCGNVVSDNFIPWE